MSRLDLVWDRYIAGTLKATARAKRGKGIRQRVTASARIPKNWQNFLRTDLNKQELFSFLSNTLVNSINEVQKELVVTEERQVLCVPAQKDVNQLAPCSHEEADSRMMLHVHHASKHGHNRILVRTVDTDVVVLAVMTAEKLPADVQIWLAFGTGKYFRYLAAHKIAASLGSEKALALHMFHALTGCDTVSAFVGHGKKMHGLCGVHTLILLMRYWNYQRHLTQFKNSGYILLRGLSYLFMTKQAPLLISIRLGRNFLLKHLQCKEFLHLMLL